MKKLIILLLLAQGAVQIMAQDKTTPDLSNEKYKLAKLEDDTMSYINKASVLLRHAKKSGIVVRLKTNSKSIEAYNQAGLENVGEKVANERKAENEKIYQAFKNNFTFAKVYFIYTDDTKKFLQRKKGLLLNASLQPDSKIALTDTNYIFCQYGTAESYSKFSDNSGYAVPKPTMSGGGYEGVEDQVLDTTTRRTTTDPMAASVLFFSDRKQQQLHTPFPMSQSIHDNEFDEAVRQLNQQLEAAYYDLVTVRDMEARKNQPADKKK